MLWIERLGRKSGEEGKIGMRGGKEEVKKIQYICIPVPQNECTYVLQTYTILIFFLKGQNTEGSREKGNSGPCPSCMSPIKECNYQDVNHLVPRVYI